MSAANEATAVRLSAPVPQLNDAPTAFAADAGNLMINPLGLGIGSLAIGVLVGWVLPVLAIERRWLRPVGDRLTELAAHAASDLLVQARSLAVQAVLDAVSGKAARSNRAA